MYIRKKKFPICLFKNPKFPFVMGLGSEWIMCRAQEVEFLLSFVWWTTWNINNLWRNNKGVWLTSNQVLLSSNYINSWEPWFYPLTEVNINVVCYLTSIRVPPMLILLFLLLMALFFLFLKIRAKIVFIIFSPFMLFYFVCDSMCYCVCNMPLDGFWIFSRYLISKISIICLSITF